MILDLTSDMTIQTLDDLRETIQHCRETWDTLESIAGQIDWHELDLQWQQNETLYNRVTAELRQRGVLRDQTMWYLGTDGTEYPLTS